MFIFKWVLINEIAIGNVPQDAENLNFLDKQGIKSILTLCSEEDFNTPPAETLKNLNLIRFVLPDHRSNREITISEITNCIEIINKSISRGSMFIHCRAGMERSPLICMAWLMYKYKMSLTQSLDYMMQIHKETNPLPSHLKVLNHLNPQE